MNLINCYANIGIHLKNLLITNVLIINVKILTNLSLLLYISTIHNDTLPPYQKSIEIFRFYSEIYHDMR